MGRHIQSFWWIQDLHILYFDILGHTLPFGTFVDGLLGMDFLIQFRLEIRPKEGEISIE